MSKKGVLVMLLPSKATVDKDHLDYLIRIKQISDNNITEFNNIVFRSNTIAANELTITHRTSVKKDKVVAIESRVNLLNDDNHVLITDMVLTSRGRILGFVNGYIYHLSYDNDSGEAIVGKRHPTMIRYMEVGLDLPIIMSNVLIKGLDQRYLSTDQKTHRILEEESLGIMSDDYVRCK